MKRHDPSDFDGFEKKPESEWTDRDRWLLDHYGVVPLTEEGEKAFREKMRQSPEFQDAMRFLDELLARVKAREAAGTPEAGQQAMERKDDA